MTALPNYSMPIPQHLAGFRVQIVDRIGGRGGAMIDLRCAAIVTRSGDHTMEIGSYSSEGRDAVEGGDTVFLAVLKLVPTQVTWTGFGITMEGLLVACKLRTEEQIRSQMATHHKVNRLPDEGWDSTQASGSSPTHIPVRVEITPEAAEVDAYIS